MPVFDPADPTLRSSGGRRNLPGLRIETRMKQMKPLILTTVLLTMIMMAAGPSAKAQSVLDTVKEGVTGAAEAIDETIEKQTEATTAAEIDQGVSAALDTLYSGSPEAKELASKAVAILVFPRITKGGLLVGGQFGEGAMRQGGKTSGYYNIAGASYGLQAGVQRFSYAMFFLNDGALQYFRENDGWEAGSGPTLVGGTEGWSASMGTNNLQGDIVPVFFGQEGLMAGAGLQGTKISSISPP